MIIFKIIIAIVIISIFIGIIALIMEVFIKPKFHISCGLYDRFIKRFFDAFLSTGAFIILSPVLLIIAILVRIKLGSPILFSQDRPGRDGKIFRLFKFRTMSNKRDEKGNLLPDSERITVFGRMLRKTSLDELPELLNIIKGDMSIIGPRPLLIKYLPYYTKEENRRHEVRPGLTGWAQINGRNSIESWERRFVLDVDYVDHITFQRDIAILLLTVKKVVSSADIIDPGILDDFDVYRKKKMGEYE